MMLRGVAGVTRSGTCVVLPEAKDIETFLSSSLPVTTGEGDAPVNSLQASPCLSLIQDSLPAQNLQNSKVVNGRVCNASKYSFHRNDYAGKKK
eukprot:5992975-Amphidinium_carterae.1